MTSPFIANKKNLLLILFTLLTAQIAFSQTDAKAFKLKELKNKNLATVDLKPKFTKYDFSALWTSTDNAFVYGYIGDNYQRIRIKFISITKDSAGNYTVTGKSLVKNNICDFTGTMAISNIRKSKETTYGLDKEYKNKGITGQYTLVGDYTFAENIKQLHVGTFKGSFKTDFYVTKNNKIHYDDIDKVSDSYTNNNFVGTWTSYDNKITKTCNWGDYRIPNSGNLDTGAGEFSPDDKYLPFGWQSVRDAYFNGPNAAKAKKEETRGWWK